MMPANIPIDISGERWRVESDCPDITKKVKEPPRLTKLAL